MIQFEIEYILELKGRDDLFIMAKRLNLDINWKLTEGSKLGGVPIKPHVSIPRKLDEHGNPQFDIFAFILKHKTDKNRFTIGEIVELTEVEISISQS